MSKFIPFSRILGLDIDDTLTTYKAEGEVLKREYPDKLGSYDFIKNNGWNHLEIENDKENKLDLTDVIQFWNNNSKEIFEKSELNPAWKHLSQQIIDPNYSKIIIITARPYKYKQVTENWLHKNHVNYDDIVFTNRHSKLPFINYFGIDMFVADEPNFFSGCTKEFGNKVTRILMDKPYNKSLSHNDYDYRVDSTTGFINE